MKKHFFIVLVVFSTYCYSQNSGIGTSSPHASAALEVSSTTKGVLPPRMTTAQRTAIAIAPAKPATGLMIYNTDINCLETYNGTDWVNMCCGIPGESGVVYGAAGKKWMTYNLGASAPALSPTDYTQYGSMYQWGRDSDGHQIVNWTSSTTGSLANTKTTTLSNLDKPNHNMFITVNNGSFDWRTPQNINLWQGINGINNPCPIGFRIPTSLEWSNEVNASKITNSQTAYNSCLKLVIAGVISVQDGLAIIPGVNSYYWTSTVNGALSDSVNFTNSSFAINAAYRGAGMSIRCIKD